jgi:DNA-directed RNA polymerase subunit RPC12/RpoP
MKKEIFDIYVICYLEMCDEIDEMTKDNIIEYTPENNIIIERINEQHGDYIECVECGQDYFYKSRRKHIRKTIHLSTVIPPNKYLLYGRVYDYVIKNKIKLEGFS